MHKNALLPMNIRRTGARRGARTAVAGELRMEFGAVVEAPD